jgi:glutaryl-CoA dehydrogenase (non-decarboxylating)
MDVRGLVRRLGQTVLQGDLEERFAAGRANPRALPAIARTGLLGLTIPERFGGLGGDFGDLALAAEELGKIDLSYQITLTVHLALTAMSILQWGSDGQRARWLPELAQGTRIATFGLTEPNAGSDVASLTMRAVPFDDGYLLNGEKTWISGANESTLFLLFATVDRARQHHGITAFLVPRDSPGLRTTALTGKLGIRAGDTGSVICHDVWVSGAQMLGHIGEGFPIALSALNTGLFTVGAGALGAAVACRELTVQLVKKLRASGLRSQLFDAEIAQMVAGEERSRLLLEAAANLKNEGRPSAQATSLAKWTAAAAAQASAESALAIANGLGVEPHPAVMRHLQNIKGAVIYGGTSEIHQVMQASYALGYRAEREMRCPPPTAMVLRGESDSASAGSDTPRSKQT